MARRRWDESWRQALCEYFETRKQKELGGSRHMSARAKPQEGSGKGADAQAQRAVVEDPRCDLVGVTGVPGSAAGSRWVQRQ